MSKENRLHNYDELIANIKKYEEANPDATNEDIRSHFKISNGTFYKAKKMTKGPRGNESPAKKRKYKTRRSPTYQRLGALPTTATSSTEEITAVIIRGDALHVAKVIAAGLR